MVLIERCGRRAAETGWRIIRLTGSIQDGGRGKLRGATESVTKLNFSKQRVFTQPVR